MIIFWVHKIEISRRAIDMTTVRSPNARAMWPRQDSNLRRMVEEHWDGVTLAAYLEGR